MNDGPIPRPDGTYPLVPFAWNARIRPSPFFERMLAAGPTAVTSYNHMVLPVSYGTAEEDYRHLTEGVTVWDVGAERQVEITGPDAAAFVQYLVTRDVSRVEPGMARYALLCQDDGGILNDPVLLRLAADHFWLSLADADMLFWARGVAHGGPWDVSIVEPDVSPLQIQGPKAPDLARAVFGDWVDGLGFFRFSETELDGVPLVVARTGWSGERGFEVFLRDGSAGHWLWDRIFEVGEPLGVVPAAPNGIRRIEVGLLSHRADMDDSMNPFELGLGRLVEFDSPDDFIGKVALGEIARAGPTRHRLGVLIGGDPISQGPIRWWPVTGADDIAGFVTSAVWSPTVGSNIGFALLPVSVGEGESMMVETPNGPRPATTTGLPFVGPRYR